MLASDAFLSTTNTAVGEPCRSRCPSAPSRRASSAASTVSDPGPGDAGRRRRPAGLPFVVFATAQVVLQPSEWWLETPNDRSVAERLRAAPFRSIAVVSRTESERALLDDPVALGVIGALALGFAVAAIFAAAGFAANAASEARSRIVSSRCSARSGSGEAS